MGGRDGRPRRLRPPGAVRDRRRGAPLALGGGRHHRGPAASHAPGPARRWGWCTVWCGPRGPSGWRSRRCVHGAMAMASDTVTGRRGWSGSTAVSGSPGPQASRAHSPFPGKQTSRHHNGSRLPARKPAKPDSCVRTSAAFPDRRRGEGGNDTTIRPILRAYPGHVKPVTLKSRVLKPQYSTKGKSDRRRC